MLLPLSLLFVGAVLVLNGIWMTGRIDDREIVLINLVTATVTAAQAGCGRVPAGVGSTVGVARRRDGGG